MAIDLTISRKSTEKKVGFNRKQVVFEGVNIETQLANF